MREFTRHRHRLVWQILESLNPALLASTRCFFGGGTSQATGPSAVPHAPPVCSGPRCMRGASGY